MADLTLQLCRFQLGETSRADSSPSPRFTEGTETQKRVVTCLGSQGGFQWLGQSILVCAVGQWSPLLSEAQRR